VYVCMCVSMHTNSGVSLISYSSLRSSSLTHPASPPTSGHPVSPPTSGDPVSPPTSGDPVSPPTSGHPPSPPTSGHQRAQGGGLRTKLSCPLSRVAILCLQQYLCYLQVSAHSIFIDCIMYRGVA